MKNLLYTDKPLVIEYSDGPNDRQEAMQWEKQAYPLGNGRLGCTLFGEPKCERIQFNQDSFWVGNEDNTGAYQPFGDVYIELEEKGYSNYRRELDISKALHTISYESEGVNFKRESFASYPAQIIVMRLTADKPAALSGKISMANIQQIPVNVEDDTIVMSGDTSKAWYWQMILENPDRLIAGREYASDKNIDLDCEARVKILNQGGELKVDGDSITFSNCDSILLMLAADTNYIADQSKGWCGVHPHEKLCNQISDAEAKGFDQLLEEHVADYQALYNRVNIDTGKTESEINSLTTAERMTNYKETVNSGKEHNDPELETLLYQFARYLMISSSREGHGALPANLQGIWCIFKKPPWRCDFHTDVNIQMNYWFTSVANLTECFTPLAGWIDSIREVRKEETKKVLGVERGWLMRSENGCFGGSTWHFQKGDSAWLCQNLWDNFTFTQDKDYLANYAYPVMKEISEFWIDHLKELPDGTLVAPDGRSPEHGPVGVDGVTYDQVLCWDLFSNTIEATDILGVDQDFRDELSEKLARLLVPKVGKWGQLQEWMEDMDDPKDDHRHVNHLICVYPGRQVTPSKTPKLAKAAKVGLIARRDHGQGHPGWSRVWKSCMFARLMDGDSAYNELKTTLATHIYDNLWAVHPPFQIDANFGFAAAVNEMLVQSHLVAEKKADSFIIELLPALPKAWPDGNVKGLRVRGDAEVDMEWKDGKLTSASLKAGKNSSDKWIVKYGDKTQTISATPGKMVSLMG